MAIDTPLKAFLDLTDGDVATYADARAAEIGLTLPEATLTGVRENLGLLRAQTALFVAALGAPASKHAGETAETFVP